MTATRPAVSNGVVAALVFVVAAVALLVEARYSPFEIDESGYVATSRYFGYLVFQHDVSREEWGVNYWTLTQPPLTRYIIGAWLTAYGYDLEKLNKPYVSTASSFEVNVLKGRVPTDDVLWRSRQPLALLGAAAIALLYVIGARFGGWQAGLATSALAISSSFVRYTLVHVWAEGPLACFFVLAVLAALASAPALISGRRWLGPMLLLALALALATSVKLTAVVGVVAFATWAAAVQTLAVWRPRWTVDLGLDDVPTRALATRLVAALCMMALTVATLWVAVNPFLWRAPLERTWAILVNRAEDMAEQQEQWPEYAVHGWAERPWLTVVGSLDVGPLAETPAAALLNLPLLAIGAAGLVGRARKPGQAAPTGMLLVWAVTYFVAIVLGLGLKYPRYFMPTTLLLLPIVGVGLVSVLQTAQRVLARPLRRPQPVA
jgi:hypothetical protein